MTRSSNLVTLRYLVQPRYRILIKSYGKNITRKLSGKYSQKGLYHAQRSARDALKTTSKK